MKRKITIKIIFFLIVIFFVTTMIPRIILELFYDLVEPVFFNKEMFLLVTGTSVALSLMVFAFIIHHIIIKRVQHLNEATTQITKGHLDIRVTPQGKDELSQLMSNFNHMVTALQANDLSNKNFIKNFSHELKTPISSILGYAQLIEMDQLTPRERVSYASIIVDEAKRITHISHLMLQLSYVQSDAIIKMDETIQVANQIRHIIQVLQIEWEKKAITWDLVLEEGSFTANEELLHHLFQNLITNAIKYSNFSGSIQVTLFLSDTHLLFTINDHGIGMTKEELSKLFTPFYRGQKGVQEHQTGLGLTLVKSIIKRFNGTISIESTPNQGTKVSLTLPR